MEEIMKHINKNIKYVIIAIVAIALVICIYLFAPIKSYGKAYVTFGQYNGLKSEQKLVDKITYGYAYYFDQHTKETLDALPDSKLYSDTGFPESSIDAEIKLTKRVNNKKNDNMGDTLMSDVDSEMNGESDIAYESDGDDSVSQNFDDQIDTIVSTAMIDLSQRGKLTNSKSKNTQIRQEFMLTTERHMNEITY